MSEAESIKLFNQGYILQKEKPALLASLMKGMDKELETFKLLKAGKEQYEIEQRMERIKSKEKKQSKGRNL